MSKKPRADSKLDNLPEAQFLQLRDGLLNRTFASYQEALSWLDVECGVSSSSAALSGFWRRQCAPLVAERRQMAAIRAEALGDAMRADPVNWDEAIVEKTKQLAFEFLDAGTEDAGAIKQLLDAILKAQKQELDERKVVLMERKAKQAEEVEKIMGREDLSEKEKGVEVRALFGMG